MNGLVLLTDGTTAALNQQWVTDFLSLFQNVVQNVFMQFPLNTMLVGTVAGVAVNLLGKAKRAIH